MAPKFSIIRFNEIKQYSILLILLLLLPILLVLFLCIICWLFHGRYINPYSERKLEYIEERLAREADAIECDIEMMLFSRSNRMMHGKSHLRYGNFYCEDIE
jgi:hypothetical protein